MTALTQVERDAWEMALFQASRQLPHPDRTERPFWLLAVPVPFTVPSLSECQTPPVYEGPVRVCYRRVQRKWPESVYMTRYMWERDYAQHEQARDQWVRLYREAMGGPLTLVAAQSA